MSRKRFWTGERWVVVETDPARVGQPLAPPRKRRGLLTDVLIIAAGGLLAMRLSRWLNRLPRQPPA